MTDSCLVTDPAIRNVDVSWEHSERAHLGATRWHLVEHRHVEIAIQGHRQGSRDGGRRHDEQIRIGGLGFLFEAHTLVNAEAMLFIDHRDTQRSKPNTLLDECVGSHDEIDLAGGNETQDILSVGLGTEVHLGGGRRQQCDPHTVALRPEQVRTIV